MDEKQKQTIPTSVSAPASVDSNHMIITIVLLLFFYPAGLVCMWVWMKTWPMWLKILLTALPFIFFILLFGFIAFMFSRIPASAWKASTSYSRQTTYTTNQTQQIAPVSSQSNGEDMTNWQTYISKQEPTLSFKYPSSWVNTDIGAPYPSGDSIQLKSPNGTLIDWSSNVSGLGGGCASSTPVVVINAVTPLVSDNKLFLVDFDASTHEGMGIVGVDANGNPPQVGPTQSCLYYTLFKSKTDSQRNMWFQVNGTVNPQDKATATQILTSLQY